METAFVNYTIVSSGSKNKAKKKKAPALITGSAIWKRFLRIRAAIMNTIVPVWNENLCFDTFPSGTQLSDFLKLVLQQLAQKESANKKVVSDDEDSDADESGETAPVCTSSGDAYATPEITRPPLLSVLDLSVFEEPEEKPPLIPMPPEWLVFVKFGPPANEHCEAVFQTESVDDARSNKRT